MHACIIVCACTAGALAWLSVLLGPSVLAVVERLSWLVGRSAPPPRWALGYLGSTMYYTEQEDAQEQYVEEARGLQGGA